MWLVNCLLYTLECNNYLIFLGGLVIAVKTLALVRSPGHS